MTYRYDICKNNPRQFLRSIFTKSSKFGKYTYRTMFIKTIHVSFYVIYLPNLGDLVNIDTVRRL